MADLSPGPSFIPKQNPAKQSRRTATRQVYLLTVVSYFLIVATLVAVAGVYLFDRYTKRVLAEEIRSLDTEIAAFDQSSMDRVIALDERLRAASGRLDNIIALETVLQILESATIDTVQFTLLSLSQEGEAGQITVEAEITTDSFDSVLFQRSMYTEAEKVSSVVLENVEIELGATGAEGETLVNVDPKVRFSAIFSVAKDEAKFIPDATMLPAATSPTIQPPLSPTSTPNPGI